MIKLKLFLFLELEKKIAYIDEKGEISTFSTINDNFNNFKCDDKEITRKINFAIDQVIK